MEAERRALPRLDYRSPVKFRRLQEQEQDIRLGTSQNISASGILFKSPVAPKQKSILWMELYLQRLSIFKDIQERVKAEAGGFLGRVIRVEEDANPEFFNVAVSFVTNHDAPESQGTG